MRGMPKRNPKPRDPRALTGEQLRSLRETIKDFGQGDMAVLMGITRIAYNRLEMRGAADVPLNRAIAAQCLISAKKRKT